MKVDVVVPSIGESVTEATVGNWIINNGDFAEEDEIICEIESEKATIEVVAEKAGIVSHKVKEGEVVEIGATIAQIDTDGKEQAKEDADNGAEKQEKKQVEKDEDQNKEKEVSQAAGKEETDKQQKKEEGQPSKISPVAANILQNAGISASDIKGSGSGGKITKADALEAIEKGVGKAKEKAEPAKQQVTGDREERREKMTTLRKTIARRLLDAKHGTAMLTTFNEIDLVKVKELRAQYKEIFKEKHGVGLGFMSFFTKACSIALEEMSRVNAMIDGDDIVYHDYVDIGIAVSTDKGLVVPVIRNAHKLSLHEIELEIVRLAIKARDGKLSIDEMTGGTFTITNGGVFGSMLSTPIINSPQSAILGMHNIIDRPVAVNGEVVIRPMMYVAMSYDHRIIDGKESVTFVKRIKELLEEPARIILEV